MLLDAIVKFRDFWMQRGNIREREKKITVLLFFFFSHMLFSYLGNEEQPSEGQG